jgi:hypothetical protein
MVDLLEVAMGFSEDLKAETRNAYGCNVAALRAEMGASDLVSFDTAMDDAEGVPSKAIERAVKRGGYEATVGKISIRKHRRRECACFEVTS